MKFIVPGPAVREGGAETVKVMPTVCGLPLMAIPALKAASDIEPVYEPAARDADVTVTVKVALVPLVTFVEAGETASHPVPFAMVAVGVMVTFPVHAPLALMVKV